jgi:Protein of unknown function (DUF3892)
MAAYQITCVVRCTSPRSSAPDYSHSHITDVGFGDISSGTVADIYKFMSEGDAFYTFSRRTGQTANVQRYRCDRCDTPTLRSRADGVWNNDLDNLPTRR